MFHSVQKIILRSTPEIYIPCTEAITFIVKKEWDSMENKGSSTM